MKARAVKRSLCWATALVLLVACAPHRPRASGGVPHRIAILVPSLVEDAFAVGAGPQVVATSDFVGDVPGTKGLPRVADFDSVDAERIVALRPDLVLGIPAQARFVAPLHRAGLRVVLIPDDTYADIFSGLRTVGALTGHVRAAAHEIASLRRATARLRARVRRFAYHPKVFVALGTGPIWTVGRGSYIATLIALAGGRNAADDLGSAYGEYAAEALVRAQPDAIVTDPGVHLSAELQREPWRSLRAVALHRVFVVRPAAILERPGPRYVQGLAWLIDRLAPLAAAR